jgi:hypothetical protein
LINTSQNSDQSEGLSQDFYQSGGRSKLFRKICLDKSSIINDTDISSITETETDQSLSIMNNTDDNSTLYNAKIHKKTKSSNKTGKS